MQLALDETTNDLILKSGAEYPNILIYSEEFDNPVWAGSATVTPDTVLSPDGTLTADTLDDYHISATLKRVQLATPTDSDPHTASFHIKEGTALKTAMDLTYSGGTQVVDGVVEWDWATHSLSVLNEPVSAYGSEYIADGWYRIWMTVVNNGTGNDFLAVNFFPAGIIPNGSQVGTVHVWGAQTVIGTDLPQPYQKTVDIPGDQILVGGVERVDDGRYTIQLVKNRLNTVLGEWLLDPRIGWLNTNDFEKGYDLFDIELRARTIISSTPNVKEVTEMNLEVKNRILYLTFTAKTTFGIIELTIPWG